MTRKWNFPRTVSRSVYGLHSNIRIFQIEPALDSGGGFFVSGEQGADLRDILFDLFDQRFPGRERFDVTEFPAEGDLDLLSVEFTVKVEQVGLNHRLGIIERPALADEDGAGKSRDRRPEVRGQMNCPGRLIADV